jgi:hypothetical protein
MVGVLVAVWIYVLAAPLAFLPSGYPAWAAKRAMLRDCVAAEIGFFGDSRVEAGIIPASFGVPAINLGVAGGSSIEVESGVRRLLGCGGSPKLVVISLGMDSFGLVNRFFWTESLAYGFIGPADLWAVEQSASRLGDWDSLNDTTTQDGLSGRVRDWLYALHFPSLYFSSLTQGQVFRRYGDNAGRLDRIGRAHGFVPYPAATPQDSLGPEAKLTEFTVRPLKVAYLDRTLGALRDAGVAVALLRMPVKAVTQAATSPSVEAAYDDYLRRLSVRFANVHVVGAAGGGWPSGMFSDDVHLNARGAELFSKILAGCMDGAVIRGDCDLDWKG